MTDNVNSHHKRSRKSAPVKNAVFVGAIHKERSNIYPLRDQKTNKMQSSSTSKEDGRIDYKLSTRNKSERHSRFSEKSITSSSSVRMSTPVRTCRTSPRYRTRNRSKTENKDEHDRSRSILSSVGGRRKYHPDYDPFIEIRRAQERLERYRTHGNWKIDMLLSDDADEDLHRYEEKLKRRLSERGDTTPIELERRQLELLRRQKDIDLGKVTDRYAEYVLSIPKPERQRHHPRTPNKFRKVSRRAWDGMIRKWRKHLHNFDDPAFEDTWRSLSTTDISGVSSVSSPFSLSENTSDAENALPVNFAVRISSKSLMPEFTNAKDITASPTVRTTSNKFTRQQSQPIDDDEDTLQGQSKPVRNAEQLKDEEEDTLPFAPTTTSRRRVTRRSGNMLEPSADVLHCGLTNDVGSISTIGQKRPGSRLNGSGAQSVNIFSAADFPCLQATNDESLASPSKRAKRGILTQSGLCSHVDRS